MKVVLIDTGRSRRPENVEGWREQLGLTDADDLALIAWNHPKVALPVVDHLVFGPTFSWAKTVPARPQVTLPRRVAGTVRPHRLRVPARLSRLADLASSSSPLGGALRSRLGVKSDGVATDFALSVWQSAEAAELAAWADVVVPFDVRSRKAAWMLSRRVAGPAVPSDMTAGRQVIASRRAD